MVCLILNFGHEHEERYFEYDSESFPDNLRPIYGYMSESGQFDKPGDLDTYGNVTVKFRESVKDRTTFTGSDSLEGTLMAPSPVLNPTALSLDYLADDPLNWQSVDDVAGGPETDFYEGYMEAQIHGGLSINDIEEIIFRTSPTLETIEKLIERGIPYRVIVK